MKYDISLSFQEISLPPFKDILVVGKNSGYGRKGLFKAMEYIVPDSYEMIEIEEENVETIFIHKKILKKMDSKLIINILKEKVFDLISEDEVLKCDFSVRVIFDKINKEVS